MRKSFIFVIILLLLIIISPVSAYYAKNTSPVYYQSTALAPGDTVVLQTPQQICAMWGMGVWGGYENHYYWWYSEYRDPDAYGGGGSYASEWDLESTNQITLNATPRNWTEQNPQGYYYNQTGEAALCSSGFKQHGRIWNYNVTHDVTTPICDFEISPYPADPGTVLTLTDTSTGGEPTGYGWGYQIPGGTWDNTSLGIGKTAAYTLKYFGQYNFSHEVGNAAETDTCWYPFWSGTNYTAWNVTPTIVGNLTTNITATNLSGQFAPLNLTLIDKPFFKSQLDNMTYFGNYSSAWTGFIDNMTESVNVTFNEVEARINPFNFLTDIIMNSHNLFVVIFIPLLGYVSFPLVITSAVINIIPEPIQLLISLGLLVDLFFLVLRGPD